MRWKESADAAECSRQTVKGFRRARKGSPCCGGSSLPFGGSDPPEGKTPEKSSSVAKSEMLVSGALREAGGGRREAPNFPVSGMGKGFPSVVPPHTPDPANLLIESHRMNSSNSTGTTPSHPGRVKKWQVERRGASFFSPIPLRPVSSRRRTADRRGFWREAPGWRRGIVAVGGRASRCRATRLPWDSIANDPNPEGVASDPAPRRRVGEGFNPFRVDGMGGTIPRVGAPASRQPRAEGWNAVGVHVTPPNVRGKSA